VRLHCVLHSIAKSTTWSTKKGTYLSVEVLHILTGDIVPRQAAEEGSGAEEVQNNGRPGAVHGPIGLAAGKVRIRVALVVMMRPGGGGFDVRRIAVFLVVVLEVAIDGDGDVVLDASDIRGLDHCFFLDVQSRKKKREEEEEKCGGRAFLDEAK